MRRFDEDPEDQTDVVFSTDDEGFTRVVPLEGDWTEDDQ